MTTQAAFDAAPSLLLLNSDLRVQAANQCFYQTLRVTPPATEGRLLYDLGNGQWNIPAPRTLLEEILPREDTLGNYKVARDFEDLGHSAG